MDQNPKQLIVEKLKSANNVLVSVSKDPNVDQLAAALGLTLMLNSLSGHALTVFSGKIPNALEFLNPERSFDNSVDSLRDFIISIDKEKADKLRYKVEDNVVKIFITPYKTTLSEDDLAFSQGDYNVDVVVALGVTNRNELDEAITSHGRILHDATIASITAGGEGEGDLGAINWHDPGASSLSEMLVSMSEALESGILDKAMSTAFLTGIVSATDRFSNEKTTPKVMTMSAQLMAAGADQQLISKNLRMDRGRTKDLEPPEPVEGKLTEMPEDKPDAKPDEKVVDFHKEDEAQDNQQVENALQELQLEVEEDQQDEGHKIIKNVKSQSADSTELEDKEPSMGGVFNATSKAAHEDVKAARSDEMNKEILTHEGSESTPDIEFNEVKKSEEAIPKRVVDEVPDGPLKQALEEKHEEHKEEVAATIDHGDDKTKEIEEATKAAIAATEFSPAHNAEDRIGAQPMEMVGTDPEVDSQIQIDAHGNISPAGTEAPFESAAPEAPVEEPPKPSHFVNQPSPMGEPKLPPPVMPDDEVAPAVPPTPPTVPPSPPVPPAPAPAVPPAPAISPAAIEPPQPPAPPMAPPPLPPKPEEPQQQQPPPPPPPPQVPPPSEAPPHGYMSEPPGGQNDQPENPLFTQQL